MEPPAAFRLLGVAELVKLFPARNRSSPRRSLEMDGSRKRLGGLWRRAGMRCRRDLLPSAARRAPPFIGFARADTPVPARVLRHVPIRSSGSGGGSGLPVAGRDAGQPALPTADLGGLLLQSDSVRPDALPPARSVPPQIARAEVSPKTSPHPSQPPVIPVDERLDVACGHALLFTWMYLDEMRSLKRTRPRPRILAPGDRNADRDSKSFDFGN